MEINFRTKEESNRIQEENFLKLSPVERIYSFLQLIYFFKDFPSQTEDENKNFIIVIKDAKHTMG
ncbi:hypothetical protein [Flavobacterium yafengii]|uniref:hypothetical protein n=1 Tax=Flavobacterium yafengii TaxID=3041253 RepID=UPI0024A98D9B|nr:hypothetical protein [Flavobacterium yafengii]MDI6046207.1 hypothetical protein [Flavobacterium yafengii]